MKCQTHLGKWPTCLSRSEVWACGALQGWEDCLHTGQLRHPQVGEMMTTALTDNAPGHHLQAAVTCRERLLDVGFEAPSWVDLQRGAQPRQNELDDAEPGIKKHGWQFGATQKVEDCFLSGAMWPRLSLPSRALLRSQGGPLAGLPFTCVPTAWHFRFDAQPFRIFLLRRLWFQLPSSVRNCRCGLLLAWPSPRSLRHRGGHGSEGFCTGEPRRHASVERRAPGCLSMSGSRPSQCSGQSQAGDCR